MIIAYAIKPPFFFVTFHPISILGQGWIKIGNLFDDEIRENKKKKKSLIIPTFQSQLEIITKK